MAVLIPFSDLTDLSASPGRRVRQERRLPRAIGYLLALAASLALWGAIWVVLDAALRALTLA